MRIEKINLNAPSMKGSDKVQPKIEEQSNNNQNQELSNVYYKPISVGKRIEEHRSWGAKINPETNELSFKIFTYPDAKKVEALIIRDEKDKKRPLAIGLENKGAGVFEKTGIRPDVAKAGDKYLFRIYKKDGAIETVKDPYSFRQEEINGASTIYDHSKYKWQNDAKWLANPNRITRTSNGKDGKLSVRDARIYAINPDTFTKDGNYEGVIAKLREIKQNGFNTLEVMHIENTFSFNWGYDGVDKHAPSEYLGGPDKLKKLVDAAHGEGLNVVFDVVPNHIGPDGNQIGRSGPYVKGPNDFGDAVNYEGKDSEFVRDYMINAMMNWVDNYHVDGLRLDMTKYMESDNTLKQMAAEINYHHPDCFLIAEDGRANVSVDGRGNSWANPDEIHDKRVTSKLQPWEYGAGQSQDEHTARIYDIIRGNGNLSRLGMDSEWDFKFFHELNEALYTPNTTNLIKATLCAQDSVKYVMSHDEIGNFEGTRKIAKLMVPKLRLNDCFTPTEEDQKRASQYSKIKNKSYEESMHIVLLQKAQLTAEVLATKYQTGELDKYAMLPNGRKALEEEVLKPLGISQPSKITYARIKSAFETSFNQNEAAMAFVYSIPGAKMVFQGDESADLTPFRFFRKFESVPHEEYLHTEKGYAPGQAALKESTLGGIKYSKEGRMRMEGFRNLVSDLNKLNAENSALRHGYIQESNIVNHPSSNVVALNSVDWESDNEIFAITNFGETNYREDKCNEYWIKFPEGKWVEILNTDDEKYGGTNRHLNSNETIQGDGMTNRPISIAGCSTVYFKRID